MPSDGTLPTVVKEWGLTKRDQIQANSTTSAPFKIVIVGGTSAVPDAGVDLLLATLNTGDLTPSTKTRISGSTRAATAKAVMTQTNAAGSNIILSGSKELFIANENSFADAMSIAPYLFNAAAPLVLTGKDSLGADALAVIKSYKTLGGTKVTLLGGVAALSEQIVKDIVNNSTVPLSSVSRIFGADRYATSVAISNYVDASSVNAANFSPKSVVLVNGSNFADGLAAAPYVGFGTADTARLMYLTDGAALSSGVAAKLTALAKVETNMNSLYVVGGTAAVSATVVAEAISSAQALNTTSTMTCVESTGGTSVKITVPGNITGTAVATETNLGDEAALILNGSMTINGTSNTSNAATAMADSYSSVTGNTTLTGLVTAGTLAKNTVITWSGLTELANAAVGKRTIAGSSCTVADDKTGPTATVSAQVGATEFYVSFSEKVTGFDCTDITATIASFNTGANIGCGAITGPDPLGTTYNVASLFEDLNNDGALTAALNVRAVASVATDTDLMTTAAAHGYSVGDKIVCVTDTVANNGTFFVASVPASTTYGVNAVYATALAGTLKNLTLDADADNTGAGCTRSVEATTLMVAGDSIKVDTRSAAAPVAIASIATITTAGIVGGTVTTATAHGLAIGDKITISGATEAADNGSYEVLTVPLTTTFTVRGAAALAVQGAAGGTVSEYFVNDLSNNAGSTQTTKTLNAVSDADVTKPVLTLTVKCTQGTDAVLSNGTTLKATSTAFGPQGVNGNVYKMSIVNVRGSLMPTVVVDATAKTITVSGDMAYVSASDVQSVYAQAGGVAWTFATQTGTASSMIGSASATTAATVIKSSGGNAGDVVGAQSCALSIKSTEKLQTIAADAVTGVVAINGVATACTANPCTSAATTETAGWSSIAFTEKFDAWTSPIADGTVTVTLTSTAIKDAKGNVVTTLALVD
jgi:putative cell wall-binding protein